jgi:rhodanese-related sulfurtransferase
MAIEAREALALWRRKKAVFVDLRDWEMVDANGWIEGSLHCPPGEFASLIDPASPLHTRLFEPGVTFVFYGGPNTAPLAAARRARALGLHGALALRGGLTSWRNAGGRIAGHPNSPLPALRASIAVAKRYTGSRLRRFMRRLRGANAQGGVSRG